MAKFKKLVVTPGVVNVGRLDGSSEVIALTPDRLKGWVNETKKLIALGIHVPAPFAHQDAAKHFPLPVRIGGDGSSLGDAYSRDGLSWDAQVNGGFWDDLEVDATTNGINAVVDAPGEVTDPNSPAGKIGTTVKETSVLVMGPRTVYDNDGKEHQIGEHLAHVAMCLHAAQPGQRNFEPLAAAAMTPDLKLAMSFCMSDEISKANSQVPSGTDTLSGNNLDDPTKPKDQELVDTILLLANVTYISLPPNTTREQFITNLNLCLRQKAADQQEQEKEQDQLTQRPQDASTKSPQIAMNQTLQNGFAQVPPVVGQAAATAAQPTSADAMLAIMMSNLVVSKKDTIKKRIDSLVGTGRITKAYADKSLYPRCEAIVMSAEQVVAANGQTPRDSMEDLIEGLEAAQPLAGPSMFDDANSVYQVPPGAHVETVPDGALQDISDAEADEMIADACLV